MKKHTIKSYLFIEIVLLFFIIMIFSILIVLMTRTMGEQKMLGESVQPAASMDVIEEEEIVETIAKQPETEIIIRSAEEGREKQTGDIVIQYHGKEIVIPKAPVAPANSPEDGEKNKKSGGTTMKQENTKTVLQKSGANANGIDVSAYQGKIDWKTVAASGVDFAIIRCGFRGQTEGKIYEDQYFEQNMKGAISNGIKVGVYFYSTAINEEEALEEAAWVVARIAAYPITYPVVYDFEDFENYRCENVDGEQATKNALAFLEYVKSKGYEPMMYANKYAITRKMNRSSFPYKFWLAHYVTQTDYQGSYQMWQYTSQGSVPGIQGNVDMDVAYFQSGSAKNHKHDYQIEVKGSFIAPTCSTVGKRVWRCTCGETTEEEIPTTEHQFGEWFIEKESTVKEAGVKRRLCQYCGKSEMMVTPKLKQE